MKGEENMCTKSELNNISQMVAKTYRNHYGDKLIGVYLYGSYARGDFDDTSDIDYAAIVEGERVELDKKLKLVYDELFEVGYEYDLIVSPVVIPYDEFENMKEILPYYRNIWNEGVTIHV